MATDGTASGGAEQPQPVRTMDDIARLFMSGARDAVSAQRQPPAANAPEKNPVAGAPAMPPASFFPPSAQVMITALTADAGWHSALSAAKHLAAEWDLGVGVIGSYRGKMQILRAGPPRHGYSAIAGGAKNSGDLDIQIARALTGVQENVGCWLIVLPLGRSVDFVLSAVRDWLLVSGTDNESVVAAYRVLKNVAGADPLEEPRQVRLFLSCDDYAQAAVVHTRLKRAAKEFLDMELPLAGVNCGTPAEIQTLAEFDVGNDDSAAWSSVSEFLHDLLGSVSESDEEIQTEESQPVPTVEPAPVAAAAKIETPPRAENPIVEETPVVEEPTPALGEQWNRQWQPPITRPPHPMPPEILEPEPIEAAPMGAQPKNFVRGPLPPSPAALKAIELSSITDDARWGALLACAADLCNAQQIEARPPHFANAAIFLDNAGHLHVWILEAGAGANFLELWTWARDHRQILALTKRDRWVDTDADIRLHLVAPAESKIKPASFPNLTNYRLTLFNLAGKTIASVIPA
jgi:hypothetical protein